MENIEEKVNNKTKNQKPVENTIDKNRCSRLHAMVGDSAEANQALSNTTIKDKICTEKKEIKKIEKKLSHAMLTLSR